MRPILLIALVMVGTDIEADCAPEQFLKIVFRDATPGVDANSFAAKPKTLYRYGSHYARVEEEPNPQTGIHGLIVVNKRDTWMVNLATSSGQHIVDTAESYDFHAPLVGGPEDPADIMEMEFGCEIAYMSARGVKPRPITIAELNLVEYQTTAEKYTFRLLVVPEHDVPFAFGFYEGDKLVYYVRYMEYGAYPTPEMSLFEKPVGIEYREAE